MSSFDQAFDDLLGNEGGYSNNPADPGGETMWGITARVARAHGYSGQMRNLPRDTAKQVYRLLYWDPLHCDEYDPRISFQVFDANVNGGHVVQWMQQAAGAKADGTMGPATIAAVKAQDTSRFIMRFLAARLTYLTLTRPWPTFGAGWCHRIAGNLMKGAA